MLVTQNVYCFSLTICSELFFFFFFQAEDGIRDADVTGVQTCALPISEKLHILTPPRAPAFGTTVFQHPVTSRLRGSRRSSRRLRCASRSLSCGSRARSAT